MVQPFCFWAAPEGNLRSSWTPLQAPRVALSAISSRLEGAQARLPFSDGGDAQFQITFLSYIQRRPRCCRFLDVGLNGNFIAYCCHFILSLHAGEFICVLCGCHHIQLDYLMDQFDQFPSTALLLLSLSRRSRALYIQVCQISFVKWLKQCITLLSVVNHDLVTAQIGL